MHYDTIAQLSDRIHSRQLSPVDVVHACLARIEWLNPRLNAFISVLADDARAQAMQAERELDTGMWRGPLHGIPIGVKDFYDTAGARTTAGAEAFSNRVPDTDAEVVVKLKEAGAVIVGKTNMDTLGMATTGLTSWFGRVHNPWDDDYVTGGSSAGSAVAVAAGLCWATVDTDAVGSVRIPAACCGVVGLKATHDVISVQGIMGDAPVDEFVRWMGHAGITARSPHDAALVLEAVAQRSGQDFSTGILDPDTTIRVGVGDNVTSHPHVTAWLKTAVEFLTAKGYAVAAAEIPLSAAEGFAHIERDRTQISTEAFTAVDVLLLPTLDSPVPTVQEAQHDPAEGISAENTAFANYYGLPAVSVPCGFDLNGLPVGLQVVGRPDAERQVLNIAQQCASLPAVQGAHPCP